MKFMKNKKLVFAVIFCITILSVVFLVHRERLVILFRGSTSLNFQRDDMEYIRITSQGNLIDISGATIDCPEKVNEVIKYLNSLELVEAETPRRLRNRRPEEVGSIIIHIGHSPDHNPGDTVQFWANYMSFVYHDHKFYGYYNYYVRNSGFDNSTKTSNVYYFLRDLINE